MIQTFAQWLVVGGGVLVLLLVFLLLLERFIRAVMDWFGIWTSFLDFCRNRGKCTCGAVGKDIQRRRYKEYLADLKHRPDPREGID